MTRNDIINPYPLGSDAAVAFDAWIDARFVLMAITKHITRLTQEHQSARTAHVRRIHSTRRNTPFLWNKQDEYTQVLISERDAITDLAQTEKRLIALVGRPPIIHLD